MKNLNIKMLALSVLTLAMVGANAAPNYVAGYPATAESRFVTNVWGFIKNFQGWQGVGGHTWATTQYYYAEPRFFTTESRWFADAAEMVYTSGHGTPYYFETNKWNNIGFRVQNASGLGNSARSGRTKFLTIQSCQTVLSALDRTDWWSPWLRNSAGNGMFQGLHQLTGYRTDSFSDNGISNRYAQRLKANVPVWQAWFQAVDGERSWWRGASYPGFASAMVYPGLDNDTLGRYGANPPFNHTNLRNYSQR